MAHEVSEQGKATARAFIERLAETFSELPRDSEPTVSFQVVVTESEPVNSDE
jgi:hypothetical protein